MTPVAGSVLVNFTSDPQIRYDRFTGRWFASIIDVPCTTANCSATAANRWLLAVSDAAKDRSEKLDALNKEIETLNKAFNGWTFALPSYKFADMSKSMDDMLKPIEQKKADAKTPTPKKKP